MLLILYSFLQELLAYSCIVTINGLWLFLMVPWVGMQYVIVEFPDHTHLLFNPNLCFSLVASFHNLAEGFYTGI